MRPLARWRSRAHHLGEQWETVRRQWDVERDLERAVSGDEPILVGPWLSEVGYEVLYWIPFVRWVAAAYRIPSSRLVVMSRGGADVWYRDIASRHVEAFDHISPGELAARATAGVLKQRDESDLDRTLIDKAAASIGVPRLRVLHPSLMFRWFAPFWSGHETLAFVERHTRFATLSATDAALPVALPPEYIAAKFYGSRALPDDAAAQAQVRALVDGLSQRYPVVHLDTGLGVDDHADYALEPAERILSVRGRLPARTNLAAQTRIIAGARMFVGTCGSLAWLAPLLGVPTLPVFTDASFLHAHLHVARRVYGRVRAGRFSPIDLAGLVDAGLAIGRGDALLTGRQVS